METDNNPPSEKVPAKPETETEIEMTNADQKADVIERIKAITRNRM